MNLTIDFHDVISGVIQGSYWGKERYVKGMFFSVTSNIRVKSDVSLDGGYEFALLKLFGLEEDIGQLRTLDD
jgi:hypothetical protein